jgi:hypothetical protein
MTFTLTDSAGGSALQLVHGPGAPSDSYAQGPTGGQAWQTEQKVDEWPQTRGQWALVLPRLNHAATRSFGALRQFAAPEAAEAWAAQHALAVQGLTRLVFSSGALTLRLHGAMQSCAVEVRGVSALANYTFRYGKVEAVS